MNEISTEFELAAELKRLKDYKKELETMQKEANEKIENVEHKLAQMMLESGNDNFSLNGYKFTVKVANKFSCLKENNKNLLDILESYGYEPFELISIPWQTLNNVMRPIYEENGETLPNEFDGIVSCFEKTGVSVRKESGKGGKSRAGKTFKRKEEKQ